MVQVGVGSSQAPDTERATQEAVALAMQRAQLTGRADLAVVFATPNHGPQARRLLRTAQHASGAADIVGCSGVGVLTTDGEIERTPGLAVMVLRWDGVTATRFFAPNLRRRARTVGKEIGSHLRPALGAENLLVLLPDTYNFDAAPLFGGLRETLGDVTVVGGGASEDGSTGETFQLCGNTVSNDAVTGFLLAGEFRATVGIAQSCRPVGSLLTVTRAQGNLLLEIDGHPAFDAFRSVVCGPLIEDLRRAVASVFIGVPCDPAADRLRRGRYLVRNIVGVDRQDGRLAVAHQLHEGDRIAFVLREPNGAREDFKSMLEEQARQWAGQPPAFGLYFDCLARGQALYGLADIDSAYLRQYFGDLPVVGFFSGAEIAPVVGVPLVHQYSGVLVLVGEARSH